MHTEVVGQRGRYVVEAELGAGAVGVVYRGRRVDTGEPVALKVLRSPTPDEETRRRFEQEAYLGQSFAHENVVRVLDHGVQGGRSFLVMELVPGETLQNLFERGLLPRSGPVTLVATLARALHEAHRRGIVHRDVKPANVIVTPEGRPVLTDFGFAKDLRSDAALTADAHVVGTPSFMAPEQASGLPATHSVDVYALGAVLYLLTTGRVPFRGASVPETLRLVATAAPVPPRRLVPGIAPALEAIILRCLAKAPADRYASARELADALEAFAATPLVPAEEGSGVLPIVLGSLALVAVGGLVGALVWRLTAQPGPVAPASTPAPSAASPTPSRAPQATPAPTPTPASTPTPRPIPLAPTAATGAALEVLDDFRIAEALGLLEPLARANRTDARTQGAYARALAAAGRAAEALAADSAACALDPTSDESFPGDARLFLEHSPDAPGPRRDGWGAPSSCWELFRGGVWGERAAPEADASGGRELLGTGLGCGPFNLGALIRKDAPASPRYRVSVDVSLEGGNPGAYAGIIFGARSPADYFAAYLISDRTLLRSAPRAEIERFQSEHGCFPKLVRFARIVSGNWEIRGQAVLPFPDTGFVPFALETDGDATVKVRVGSSFSQSFTFDRPVDGRVGLLKYYDTSVRFRRWEWARLP